jgi:phosphoribosylaminoimidazole-succinocarboxamide synthase
VTGLRHPGNNWELPEDIVEKTIDKYLQGYELITGKPLV